MQGVDVAHLRGRHPYRLGVVSGHDPPILDMPANPTRCPATNSTLATSFRRSCRSTAPGVRAGAPDLVVIECAVYVGTDFIRAAQRCSVRLL